MVRLRRLLPAVVAIGLFVAAPACADTGPSLLVDATTRQHAISPDIYGWNFAPADIAAQIDLPVDRRGGNAADAINWQTGVENHSQDFYWENLPTCWDSCPVGWDPSHSYTDQIDLDRSVGAKSLIDLPMMGTVPKPFGEDPPDRHCSFSVAKYGAQTDADMYDTDCGDGYANPGGAPIVNDPTDTGMAAGPSFEGGWVDDLVGRYNDAANGGVGFYELGNEPGLWNSTHRDWHPDPVSADELWSKSQALAWTVKAEDPTAQVLAFSEWGWPNYFCSAADGGCGPNGPQPVPPGSDWAKCDCAVVEWLLQQFKQWADDHNGQRLIDYLDVHYYRQTTADGTDATRSLWDPTYTDPSYIDDTIRLIPRMHQWVDQNYPGTKISLSEYDLAMDSGDDDTHVDMDNLIEADTLGIFGREGLDLATLWPETNLTHYVDAFKLFRNYDGNHSKFGETSISALSDNQSQLGVYAARRASDGALTVVVINKATTDLTSTLSIANFGHGSSAQVWRFSDVATGIQRVADQALSASGFTATFPARSMSMIVIPPGTAGSTTPPATTSAPPPASTGSAVQTTPEPHVLGVPVTAPQRCTVPKLAGLTLKAAKRKLVTAHCRLGKVTKKKSAKAKGHVIAQTPKPRAKVRSGTKVAVVLSRGR
jgi:hypothetical protein